MNNIPLTASIVSLVICFIVIPPVPLNAQMFSVDDDSPLPEAVQVSSLSAGWEIASFTYRRDGTSEGTNRFDFENMGVFKLYFENPGINMYFGVAGRLTGAEGQNYINLGAVLYNDFSLLQSEEFRLFLPLQLNTDLIRTRTDISTQQFQQTAFQIGAGLGVWSPLSSRVQTEARMVPSYGFSNSQGAFVGGTVFSMDGKVRLHVRHVFGSTGLTFGYDFRFRRYDIDANLFDYDLSGHTITAGIHF